MYKFNTCWEYIHNVLLWKSHKYTWGKIQSFIIIQHVFKNVFLITTPWRKSNIIPTRLNDEKFLLIYILQLCIQLTISDKSVWKNANLFHKSDTNIHFSLKVCLVLFMCIDMHFCVWGTHGGKKRAMDPLKLVSQLIVICPT